MTSQQDKHARFVALHARPGAFVIPNPWDAGTARILTHLGFEALATTSAGLAFALGTRDSSAALDRDTVLRNAAQIVTATDLPVSADLEDGFGRSPETCAETIRMAALAGLVGGSIEDATGNPAAPILDAGLAAERIAAAAEIARGRHFVVTARAENFLWSRPDLGDTIHRLQRYQEAGADVLYAPGLPHLDAIRTLCQEVDRPVNVVQGLSGPTWSVAELAAVGVKRISVGGSFARAALGALIRAAEEVRDHGTFTYARDAVPAVAVSAMMTPRDRNAS
ncbi:isocitrate lyase/PEP mutase family protein [Rubellimicrobium roseum]|uniref:Isocitrate lyase/phosphoenolpyruvate mutase family protein n=1 Tax=Rubellimicrobium roseum TaxID=687525 RepID=A0A5C4NDU6_9RHOB|nr:isocitrate lyase/phosphoenolpyruvate mutase family protein [Rubellimicrobium roseum]TNC72793.1 isocitrate lyase/phosphoenolpyruvate mutase family protein [Rubellimicrobium roseum]